MIGKPQWFKYRVFGWGLGIKTWQGVVYVIFAAGLLAGSLALATAKVLPIWVAGAIFVLFTADVIHIMTQMPKVNDERENYHQLLIERNSSFAAIAALLGMAFYEAYQRGAFTNPGVASTTPFDTSIIVVLGAMLLTKIISTFYLRAKK
jgi:hypothetical protein